MRETQINTKDETMLKIRQNAEANKIKDLLCQVSHELPDIYTPDDFKIVADYVEPTEDYSDVKIEIKDRYTVSPILIKKRSIGKQKIHARGWLVEEIICKPSTREEPEEFDTKDIARVSSLWEVVKVILLNDVKALIDTALYYIAESEDEAADKAEIEKLELFKNAA